MEAAISYTIIPDIHGQFAKLDALLTKLGWRKERLLWRRPANDQHLVFLGDFIDRGPENRRVLETVRDLVDSGFASAIMGNHELNAIHFHTKDLETGQSEHPVCHQARGRDDGQSTPAGSCDGPRVKALPCRNAR